MENAKTILFYVLGIAGLAVISIWSTGQVEVDIRELPTATPLVVNTPTAAPTAAVDTGCTPTPRGSSYGYEPAAPLTTTLAPPELEEDRLTISGTVYADDCVTPLAGALLEVWHNDVDGSPPAEPARLRAQMRTDAAGRYQFTTVKPGRSSNWPAHIHFRVTDPGGRSVLTTSIFFDEMTRADDVSTIYPPIIVPLAEAAAPDDSGLSGIFDIVLPVAPPVEVSQRDCAATPPSTGINSYIARVPFTTTLAPADLNGTRLIIAGTVYAADQDTPLPGALLEVWHADAEGRYDDSPPFSLRAKLRTDEAGRYEFTTIRPGPVQVGCAHLPAHINYLVGYGAYRPLFMSQFFADDPLLVDYPPMRQAAITTLVEERGSGDSVLRGTFDIVLPISPTELTPALRNSP